MNRHYNAFSFALPSLHDAISTMVPKQTNYNLILILYSQEERRGDPPNLQLHCRIKHDDSREPRMPIPGQSFPFVPFSPFIDSLDCDASFQPSGRSVADLV
jgi:hypothetical protein